uniref:Putative secreted peptide n=1 Tax=Anopheles braziliensis TaxID=58242 RepID=A0A2M3ZXA9_9DIPT
MHLCIPTHLLLLAAALLFSLFLSLSLAHGQVRWRWPPDAPFLERTTLPSLSPATQKDVPCSGFRRPGCFFFV